MNRLYGVLKRDLKRFKVPHLKEPLYCPKTNPWLIKRHEEKLRAPVPFDIFLNSLPFQLFFNEGPYYNGGIRSEPLMLQLDNYAAKVGLQRLLRYYNGNKIFLFDTYIKNWCQKSSNTINENCEMKAKFKEEMMHMPSLQKPIVLYRIFQNGIYGDMPQPGSSWNIFNFQSYTLSQGYLEYFLKKSGGERLNTLRVRLDALPGTHVLPIFDFNGGVRTEYEVIVPVTERVHVFQGSDVLEGRVEMPAPPVEYEGGLFKHTSNVPKIDLFFIISKLGEDVRYNPDYSCGKTVMNGGGTIHLTDQNMLDYGNVSSIVQTYIAKVKTKTKTKTKTMTKQN